MPPSETDLAQHYAQASGQRAWGALVRWLRTEYRLACARKVELKKLLDAIEQG